MSPAGLGPGPLNDRSPTHTAHPHLPYPCAAHLTGPSRHRTSAPTRPPHNRVHVTVHTGPHQGTHTRTNPVHTKPHTDTTPGAQGPVQKDPHKPLAPRPVRCHGDQTRRHVTGVRKTVVAPGRTTPPTDTPRGDTRPSRHTSRGTRDPGAQRPRHYTQRDAATLQEDTPKTDPHETLLSRYTHTHTIPYHTRRPHERVGTTDSPTPS